MIGEDLLPEIDKKEYEKKKQQLMDNIQTTKNSIFSLDKELKQKKEYLEKYLEMKVEDVEITDDSCAVMHFK